ncbi:alpha/beta hydrolase family protein [Rhizobium rhododendri]|uniref:Alpha/beta fold hydrolase n=1 Tax=Rhizobium rhododendri TaxID=2506430 RepID=A0ABY8IJE9_9HYPH|nr:alpha/beta fold hydrolase [Rhizobium rhododendri]WFS23482.1 alpha/beta fold hydrolase [Rhizobium rhododendri]
MTLTDVPEFSHRRRAVLTGLAASVLLPISARAASVASRATTPPAASTTPPAPAAAAQPAPAAKASDVSNTAPAQMSGDYQRERRKFRTNLLVKGPAPDKYEALVAPEGANQIFYRSGYGGELELVAWVSRFERTRTPRPAVLFLHGGNAIGQGHWQLMKPYIDAGYVVMIPSMRGENGQKGNFSGFYDEVDDVLAASDRLRHMPGVDPHRMFLAGHSIGGTLAMLTAMSTRRFRAAAPISGNPDSFAFFNRYPQDIRFDDKDPREFQMRSPVCYAHSFKCPMKVMHGSEEVHFVTRVGVLSKRAREAHVNMDVDVIPGGHFSALPAEIERSIQFFKGIAA